MFFLNPPKLKKLEVWSSMPEHFRRTGVQSTWADANAGGRRADSFLEGPVFDQAGNLYVTDIPFGRVFRINARGEWALVTEYDGEPNGMKFLTQDELLITDYLNGLVLLDLRTGQTKPYLGRRNTESFKGANDLCIAKNGDIYFTDQGQTGLHDPSGRVYRLRPNGALDLLLSNVPSPNGIVLSPDEKVLFVAATRGNSVWRMPMQADGSVTKAGQFFTSAGPSGPDGLAVDADGHLYVANPGLGRVWCLNQRAEPLAIYDTGGNDSITNLALRDGQLYATNSTSGQIMVANLV